MAALLVNLLTQVRQLSVLVVYNIIHEKKSIKFYSENLKINITYTYTHKISKQMNTSDDDEEKDEEGVFILRDML